MGSNRGEFIIDLAEHPEEAESRKDRSASKFREIGGAGVEINRENEMGREEDQLSAMGDVAHVEREVSLTRGSCRGQKSQL